ncbi:MAG: phospholipase D-like domain-containing protein [Lentisphaeraceae bacterium]|nr:phospholipase D-like domain-containing protein [Lentisphaeraceae bacterium]
MKDFDYILEKIFSDFKVSRSEKEALEKVRLAQGWDSDQLAVLRSKAFDFAQEKATLKNFKQAISCLEDLNKLLLPEVPNEEIARATFSPGNDCRNEITHHLKTAKSSIDICVFTISDNVIVDQIIAAWERGVIVKIITDNDKQHDLGSDIIRIKDLGIPVVTDVTDNHMHHKFAVIDKSVLLLGSYNWTRSAATRNNEDLVVMNNQKVVIDFIEEFETLWKEFSAKR